jgi:hypothetical protein
MSVMKEMRELLDSSNTWRDYAEIVLEPGNHFSEIAIQGGFAKGFRKSQHGFPTASKKTPHGDYTMWARKSDFMVRYAAEFGAKISSTEPIEELGKFPDIGKAIAAVNAHSVKQS